MLVAKWLFFDQCFLATVTLMFEHQCGLMILYSRILFTTATLGSEECGHCGGEKGVMGR